MGFALPNAHHLIVWPSLSDCCQQGEPLGIGNARIVRRRWSGVLRRGQWWLVSLSKTPRHPFRARWTRALCRPSNVGISIRALSLLALFILHPCGGYRSRNAYRFVCFQASSSEITLLARHVVFFISYHYILVLDALILLFSSTDALARVSLVPTAYTTTKSLEYDYNICPPIICSHLDQSHERVCNQRAAGTPCPSCTPVWPLIHHPSLSTPPQHSYSSLRRSQNQYFPGRKHRCSYFTLTTSPAYPKCPHPQ